MPSDDFFLPRRPCQHWAVIVPGEVLVGDRPHFQLIVLWPRLLLAFPWCFSRSRYRYHQLVSTITNLWDDSSPSTVCPVSPRLVPNSLDWIPVSEAQALFQEPDSCYLCCHVARIYGRRFASFITSQWLKIQMNANVFVLAEESKTYTSVPSRELKPFQETSNPL